MLEKKGKQLGNIQSLIGTFEARPEWLIVGAGPSARWLHHPQFPWHRYSVIACNSACMLVRPHIWMCFDLNSWRDDWWGNAKADHYLLGKSLVENGIGNNRPFPQDYYVFEYERSIKLDGTEKLKPGKTYGGATIVGCAAQFAASFPDVKSIHFCGVDMADMHTHFYDLECEDYPRRNYHAGSFGGQLARMNWITMAIRQLGIRVAHYGPTALNVEVIYLD